MAIDDPVTPLSRVALFAGLTRLQLDELAERAEKLRFHAGDTLVKAGQAGDGAYLLVSGLVECITGPDPSSAPERVEPGSLIGEMAMLIEHNYGSTFIARERAFCLKLTRAAVHAQMLEDASLIEHFQRRITERLQHTRAELRRIEGALEQRQSAPPAVIQSASAASTPRFVPAARAWR
jgi:CRP-like cAMP-binding protein